MKQILYRLSEYQYLGRKETRGILQNIAEGHYNDSQIASLITVSLMRSISVEELTGFREALLEIRILVNLSKYRPVDIVDTGSDGKNTFSIGIRSCFIVAGAGYHAVKHGNHGATSMSGASDVMEQYGVKFTNDIDKLHTSTNTCHTAYLHAPSFSLTLKAVAPIRESLGVRSSFNMLGSPVNPVMPTYQLLGVYNLPPLRLYNYTYQESGTRFAVIHSLDGYDKISLTADFKVAMPGKKRLYTPEVLGFKRYAEADPDDDKTPKEIARIFDAALGNKATKAQKGCVTANSTFAIQMICPEKKIETCIAEARESLKDGKALATFRKFISLNR